jgi:hypothetical protein
MITRPGFGLSMFLAALLVVVPAFAFDDPLNVHDDSRCIYAGESEGFQNRRVFRPL